MAFRATAFNDPKVVDLLRSRFVCVGIAHNGAGRRKDAEGDFARKIIGKGGTLQGLHVINTRGELVGYVYDFRPQSVLAMLEKALEKFTPVEAPPIDFAREAEAAGAYGETGRDPAELQPALQRGLQQTRDGKPAVISVWLQRLEAGS